jgi:predicted nuclease of predicted toxin-antitoxin system
LVDAQLPARLAQHLIAVGHDVVHSSELPNGNRTSDSVLASLADADNRIMMTKDRDFEVSHLLGDVPRRLLLVTTGNISNNDLLGLVARNMTVIEHAFESVSFVELSNASVTLRGKEIGGEPTP